MITLKQIIESIEDWIEDDSEPEMLTRIINSQIRAVESYQFDSMRRTVTVTPDSSGTITEPASCRVINRVYSSASDGEYLPNFMFYNITDRNRLDAPRTKRYKMLPSGIRMSSEYDTATLDVEQGSQTIDQGVSSAVNLSQDMVGMRLSLTGDATNYEILTVTNSTSMTVFPDVRIEDADDVTCRINPVGMRTYKIMDSSGTPYTEDVIIDYQMSHPELADENDLLLVPAERTITLMSVQMLQRQTKYDVDAERLARDIFEAKQMELGSEVTTEADSPPQDDTFAFRSKRRTGRRRTR